MSYELSIIIVSWKNLSLLKFLVDSIRKNSGAEHEIIVHLNESGETERMWVKNQGIKLSESETNIGLSRGANQAAELATKSWLCFIDDDMYVIPGWDVALVDFHKKHNGRIWVSSTMIEPKGPPTSIIRDFGKNTQDFREAELLNFSESAEFDYWRTNSATPLLFSSTQWVKIKGYDEVFESLGAELGLAKRCWDILQIRDFVAIPSSRVYHFRSASMNRLSWNLPGLSTDEKFQERFGMNADVFREEMKKNTKWAEGSKSMKEIKIFGLHRTGTNYFTALMEKNYNVQVKINEGGWKHGFYSSCERRDKTVILVKDPFAWLVSLFRLMIKEGQLKSSQNFSEFVRNRLLMRGSALSGDNATSFSWTFPCPPDYWMSVYFHWKSLVENYGDTFVFVRYEDLLCSPEGRCDVVAKWAGLDKAIDFQNQSREVLPSHDGVPSKLGGEFNRVDYYKNRDYLKEFNGIDIAFVYERISEETLTYFGYL